MNKKNPREIHYNLAGKGAGIPLSEAGSQEHLPQPFKQRLTNLGETGALVPILPFVCVIAQPPA